ncbi:MAG TPA: winged helix DNA-binding domain-containing protein [Anaerolineaceae bacterium]|nr:winged helix DNA-binding domain-containing protein [Anaerolineaceae bacterium]
MKANEDQIRLMRLRAQHLSGNTADKPQDVVEAVCGVQAQDQPAGELSVAVRSPSLTLAGVNQAFQEGLLIRTWCMRGTLHLVSRRDAAWMIPFFGPVFAATNSRRFAQLGWDRDKAEIAIRLIHRALEDQGSLTREEIAALLKSNRLPYEGQATIHFIYYAAMQAVLVQGSDRGKEPTYVPFENWVGQLPRARPFAEALVELAQRYLNAFAPAAPADFSAWSGLSPKDARQAWDSLQAELVSLDTDRGPLWTPRSMTAWLEDPLPAGPLIRLIPRFDTYLLGYADRSLTVDLRFARRINAGGGIIHPALLVNGRVLGTWKAHRRASSIDLIIEPFEPLQLTIKLALESEIFHLAHIFNSPVNLNISAPID